MGCADMVAVVLHQLISLLPVFHPYQFDYKDTIYSKMQINAGYNSPTTANKNKTEHKNARFSWFAVTAVTLLSFILYV